MCQIASYDATRANLDGIVFSITSCSAEHPEFRKGTFTIFPKFFQETTHASVSQAEQRTNGLATRSSNVLFDGHCQLDVPGNFLFDSSRGAQMDHLHY
jgi:hypothetical protein